MKSLFQTGILGINHAMITKFLKSFDNSQKRTKKAKQTNKNENIEIKINEKTKYLIIQNNIAKIFLKKF